MTLARNDRDDICKSLGTLPRIKGYFKKSCFPAGENRALSESLGTLERHTGLGMCPLSLYGFTDALSYLTPLLPLVGFA